MSIAKYSAKLRATTSAIDTMNTKQFLRKMKCDKNFARLADAKCGAGKVRSKKSKRCVWDAETKHDKERKWLIAFANTASHKDIKSFVTRIKSRRV